MITAIDPKDVSRITSGQVIIELVSAVKELIDNSIDAGADKIDVTFAEHASKYLEVSDNGRGIDPSDYEALCLKYHTSKLSSYEGLSSVTSLGFRGEAMSSLCSVATIAVVTSSEVTFPKAAQLQYDNMGKLISKKSSVTGKKGTTVTMTNLFKNLPVRYKNFLKHSKKEYTKALSLIIAYLLAYTNIRFTVFSIGTNGKRQMVLGTPGGKVRLADVMVNVYGSNGAYGLLPIDIKIEDIEAKFRLNTEYAPSSLSVKLQGAISDCSFGMGRSATDRQFISINKRPVLHKRLTKVINEVYRSFNTTQSPTFVLDLQLDTHFLDVNITPDKRSVLIHTEDLVLDVIREEITKFYEGKDNVVPKSTVGTLVMGSSQNTLKKTASSLQSPQSRESEKSEKLLEYSEENQGKNSRNSGSVTHNELFVTSNESNDELMEDEEENFDGHSEKDLGLKNKIEDPNGDKTLLKVTLCFESDPDVVHYENLKVEQITFKNLDGGILENVKDKDASIAIVEETASKNEAADQLEIDDEHQPETHVVDELEDVNEEDIEMLENFSQEDLDGDSEKEANALAEAVHVASNDEVTMRQPIKTETRVEASLHSLKVKFPINEKDLQIILKKTTQNKLTDMASLHDITQIMEIRKQDFATMTIVGQFNSGFIIVTHEDKLLIVDQHALDEIYNYERLMNSLVLRAQPLVVPRVLELSPIDEMRMLEFSAQLRKNGFLIEEEEDAPPGQKVRLLAVPVLKNVVFDDGDLHELVTKLHEHCSLGSEGVSAVRCTKTEKTIALRACRLSIMIGLALLKNTMSQVVLHLSTLARPWNCPHGRPTFRHLADLEGLGFQADYLL